MADDELTREEIFALAGAFPVDSAKTLLRLVRFPSWAIPETGYVNSLQFWTLIAQGLGDGVMTGGRQKILEAAAAWLPASGKFAAFVAEGRKGAEGQKGTAALRVLVIGASPIDADLPHVRADREARAIENVALPDRVAVKVVLGAEATDVRHVGLFRPDIVHFVCHGTADSLVFSDARGESDYVAAARVADRLRFYCDEQGVRLRGIVLAACDGQTLAPFFAGVADTVIAHRGKLADQCGVAFAERFYAGLNNALMSADGNPLAADLAALAREAAQLAAQYSAVCDPVIAQLILLPVGG